MWLILKYAPEVEFPPARERRMSRRLSSATWREEGRVDLRMRVRVRVLLVIVGKMFGNSVAILRFLLFFIIAIKHGE